MSTATTRIVLDSQPAEVTGLQPELLALCTAAGLDASAAFQLTVAVIEAVNNSIAHAYDGQPGHPVSVCLRQVDGAVEIEVRDQGRPLPAETLDAVTMPDASSESGRGWPIIRQWTDSVRCAREANENVLILSRRLESSVLDV